MLVEEFVAGTEVECGVLGNLRPAPIASVVGEIVPHAEWYDYAAKYDEGGSDIIVPARIPDETAARVQELAVDSFIATECEGMARVDFFVREDGEVVVNELNTIPGFTATSVYARLFEASGIPYAELLDRLIQLALERHERRSGSSTTARRSACQPSASASKRWIASFSSASSSRAARAAARPQASAETAQLRSSILTPSEREQAVEPGRDGRRGHHPVVSAARSPGHHLSRRRVRSGAAPAARVRRDGTQSPRTPRSAAPRPL